MRKTSTIKFFSTFSGIGGFEIGIQNAHLKYASLCEKSEQKECAQGRERPTNQRQVLLRDRDGSAPLCVGYSEIDKYAISVYENHFKGVRNYGDITKINAEELPDFDCLVGGFPCQSFSIAGKRGGFDDARGTLFFDLARILQAKKPRLFVFENVKGLLSHDAGRTFRIIISTLDELGYDVQWQVLNSKDFGVPQNRERVIIVGHLRGTPRPQVFPIVGVNGKDIEKIVTTGHQATDIYSVKGSATTQSAGGGGQGGKTGLYVIPVLTPDRLEKRQNGRRFKTDGEPSFTLNTQDRHGVFNGCKIRRLTPLECERLQGFPDCWTKVGMQDGAQVEISDTQRYKMCGNAVTTNVIQAVFEKIFESMFFA